MERFNPLPLNEEAEDALKHSIDNNDPEVIGIVDEEAGGFVAYVLEPHMDTVLKKLNTSE